MWDSGYTENCLTTLWQTITDRLFEWIDPDDDEWSDMIILTKKFINYSERSRNINSQLFEDNYPNMAEDIPKLETIIDIRQHLREEIMDKNIRYFAWLLRYKSRLSELSYNNGDTVFHLACRLNGRPNKISGKAANLLLDSRPNLELNRQNFDGETALHCLCKSIAGRIYESPWEIYLPTLRRLLLHQDIDVDIQDYPANRKGRVASWHLAEAWDYPFGRRDRIV